MINLEELKILIRTQNISDFKQDHYATRIRQIIRTKELDSETQKVLWDLNIFKWYLARSQKLSNELKESYINNLKNVNNLKVDIVDRNLYKVFLSYQELSEDLIKKIGEKANYFFLIIAWKTKTDQMLQYNDYHKIFSLYKQLSYDKSNSLHFLISAIIAIINHYNNALLDLIKEIFKLNELERIKILRTMSIKIFFNDETINFLKDSLDELNYNELLTSIVMHNNCSLNKKAMFFLNK